MVSNFDGLIYNNEHSLGNSCSYALSSYIVSFLQVIDNWLIDCMWDFTQLSMCSLQGQPQTLYLCLFKVHTPLPSLISTMDGTTIK